MSADEAHSEKLYRHILGQLSCLGRHTVTGILCSSGRQFCDWSADYRLYSEERFCEDSIFDQVKDEVSSFLAPDEPLIAAMDDSILRKRGRKIHGSKFQRDPLSPPFHTNLVLSQRFIQISAGVPNADGSADMIPVDFLHAPLPQKPRPKAPQIEWDEYERARQKANINLYGAQRLEHFRNTVDQSRQIIMAVDGRFTNSTLLEKFPENMTFIGRVRGDAHLLMPCHKRTGKKGRPRKYLSKAPTPKELLRDESVPWREVQAFAAGEMRTFKLKTIAPLLWNATGSSMTLRLLVVAPVKYRLTKNSKLLRREPAFLICSAPEMPVEKILQSYIWRWGIENNFRDEKTLLGVGQAQVRKQDSAQKAPALAVAAYSILLLSALKAFRSENAPLSLPQPKWRSHQRPHRPSTAQLINQLRVELWSSAMDLHILRDFLNSSHSVQKPEILFSPLKSATFFTTQ